MTRPTIEIDAIPACLKQRDQWVCWKFVEWAGKLMKCPVDAKSGRNASASDPATWTTFERAWDFCEQAQSCAGIAFAFSSDDQFCGIDIDDCLDEEGNLLWGQDLLEIFDSYCEVSPSGRGLKLFIQGKKPAFARCKAAWGQRGTIEVYDSGRVFAVTGRRFDGMPNDVVDRQSDLDALCTQLWTSPVTEPSRRSNPAIDRCLSAMLRMQIADHNDGSHRLFAACCRAVEYDLTDPETIACVREYERIHPFPKSWSNTEIRQRLLDAEGVGTRGAAKSKTLRPDPPTIGQLLLECPSLREPVIYGLLRRGETMNVIASPKAGKSWLASDLAIALVTGQSWFSTFETTPGKVLLIDNELHRETVGFRVAKVCEARSILFSDIANRLHLECLRGRLVDIFAMADFFHGLDPGQFNVVVIDSLYRMLPAGTDENDNAAMCAIFNAIDGYADWLEASFVLVHHSSKGNQSGKSVTDVGSGAGSMSRATDTHLILRPHQEDKCAVLDAAVRSWPPIGSCVFRWEFPAWTPDDALDPGDLKSSRPRRRSRTNDKASEQADQPEWTAERFAELFLTTQPTAKREIVATAVEERLSARKAGLLLRAAEDEGLAHRWRFAQNRPIAFATEPQRQTPLVRAITPPLVPPGHGARTARQWSGTERAPLAGPEGSTAKI